MKKTSLFAILASALILSACGDSYSSDYAVSDNWSGAGAVNTMSVSEDYLGESESRSFAGSKMSSDSEADIVLNTAMIARSVNVSLTVSDLEAFQQNLSETVATYGGYFEENTINDYSSEYSTSRSGYFTLRIPKENLDSFLTEVDENGKVTKKSMSAEDVSLQYVDTTAKKKSLEQEKRALENLMDNATTTSEIIEIQDRISQVQYQLDSANGQKRYLEGRVDYSYVYITATQERNVDHPIRRAFSINFKDRFIDGIETFVEVVVGIIVAIPTIAFITAAVIFFIWILKKVSKKVFKKNKKIRYVIVPAEEIEEVKHE